MPKYAKRRSKRKPTRKGGQRKSSQKIVKVASQARGVNPYGVKAEPFPRVLFTRARFGENRTISTSFANVCESETYRLSTIYDPAKRTGGTTVTGHAQLAAIYDQYWVMGAKVSVRFYDVPSDSWLCGVRLRLNGNGAVSGEDSTTMIQRPLTYVKGISNTGNQQGTFKFYIKPWTLVGVSKLEYMANSSSYSSFISANPATVDNCLLDVFCVDMDTTGTVKYEIRIDYYVKLYGRKELSAS